MQQYIRRILGEGADMKPADTPQIPVPVVWLLGKTGAGKSSIVSALTGEAETGDGFAPCTQTAQAFDYPADQPVLRFLDTRGLGEANYDPTDDLAQAEQGSHAVLVVARLDDPVQGAVADVLADLCARRPRLTILVVHTGADLLRDDDARERARSATQARFDAAAGRKLRSVTLALAEAADADGLDVLRHELARDLPKLSLLLHRTHESDDEARRFAALRPMVLWYAGAAAATDAPPGIGTVGVPALQGAMLHRLAARYDLQWTPRRAGGFATALGTGVVLRLALGHGARQVAKLVPVLGQTLGAAAAAAISFAATYALGRAAALWLYRTARDEPVSRAELRQSYAEAFRRARDGSR